MFKNLKPSFKPMGVDFEALRDAGNFNPKVQRLRDLQAPETQETLSTPEQETEKLVQLETLDSKLQSLPVLPSQTGQSKESPPSAPNLARQIRQEKTKIRLEKLKDLENHWQTLGKQLNNLKAISQAQAQWNQWKKFALNCRGQISLPYTGKTALTEQEGMGNIRPVLVKLTQKISCLEQNQRNAFDKLRQSSEGILDKLKSAQPISPLEKTALLALNQTLDQVITDYFTRLEAERPAATSEVSQDVTLTSESMDLETLSVEQLEAQVFQAQQRLKQCKEPDEQMSLKTDLQRLQEALEAQQNSYKQSYLHKALRKLASEQEALNNLETKLPQAKDVLALRLLKGGLVQMRNHLAKDWQSLGEWFQSIQSPQGILQTCLSLRRRLTDTRAADFGRAGLPSASPLVLKDLALLPGSLLTLVESYFTAADVWLGAFESLLVQVNQQEEVWADQAKLAELEGILSHWQTQSINAFETIFAATDEQSLLTEVNQLNSQARQIQIQLR